MLFEIGAATDGGRRVAITMGDYNVKADELEVSGILRALGLTLVKAETLTRPARAAKDHA